MTKMFLVHNRGYWTSSARWQKSGSRHHGYLISVFGSVFVKECWSTYTTFNLEEDDD